MRYVGSKARLARSLVPEIQAFITPEIIGYVEPFVGGGNLIDKIRYPIKIGSDIHEELIALLRHIQDEDNVFSLPETISEDEYVKVKENRSDYPKWYVGLVGFCSTFGAKYFGGYARGFKSDGVTPRDLPNEAIRNLKEQSHRLKDIKFYHRDFRFYTKEEFRNHVFYCDIPYKGTLEYENDGFPYDEFYGWAREMSTCNTILVSEYDMPTDFKEIWSIPHKTLIASTKISGSETHERLEKLFVLGNPKKVPNILDKFFV